MSVWQRVRWGNVVRAAAAAAAVVVVVAWPRLGPAAPSIPDGTALPVVRAPGMGAPAGAPDARSPGATPARLAGARRWEPGPRLRGRGAASRRSRSRGVVRHARRPAGGPATRRRPSGRARRAATEAPRAVLRAPATPAPPPRAVGAPGPTAGGGTPPRAHGEFGFER